jgi:hypothetical protein
MSLGADSQPDQDRSPDQIGECPGSGTTRTAGEEAPATDAVAGAADLIPGLVAPEAAATDAVAGRRTPPPGWTLLNTSAVKLWVTLAFLGVSGRATQKQLAEAAGLSERTVLSALGELQALGLLTYQANQGQGTTWQLLPVPGALPGTASDFFRARTRGQEQGIVRRRERLDQQLQEIEDAVSGADQERFRRLTLEITPPAMAEEPAGGATP